MSEGFVNQEIDTHGNAVGDCAEQRVFWKHYGERGRKIAQFVKDAWDSIKRLAHKIGQGISDAWKVIKDIGKQVIHKAINAGKIFGGLFATDKSRTVFERIGQVVSRFTWQLPQTLLGFIFAQGANLLGKDVNVTFWHGATVVSTKSPGGWAAFTMGSFIMGYNITDNQDAMYHEYGHYIQSRKIGWAYIFVFAIPSWLSYTFDRKNHDNFYTERDANNQSRKWFSNQ